LVDVTSPTAATYNKAGTVDYMAGIVTMDPVTITSFGDSLGLEVIVKPVMSDVSAALNDIITIDTARGISVKVRKA
jgi:hypothetical protein